MANEVVDFYKSNKTKGFILKLVIKKAFDKVSWNFIDYIIKRRTIQTLGEMDKGLHCSNIQYFVLINGKPHGRINSNRGIHEGDPRSPLIFFLAMGITLDGY